MRIIACIIPLLHICFALSYTGSVPADPTPFQRLFYQCHGDAWLGSQLGEPISTPHGHLLRYEHGSIFSSRSHNGCFGDEVKMVDGRLLDNPSNLDEETLRDYVENDPILSRNRKCVVYTLIDQKLRKDNCDDENIHPYCEGSDYWCTEFASWVYRNPSMKNIEGQYRHLSSMKWANQLKRVFEHFNAYVDDDDIFRTTAEPGDFLILKNSSKHTTLVVAVNIDGSYVWTIGGSEYDTVGFQNRSYFNPNLDDEIQGIGLISSKWFDYENAYLEQCQGHIDSSFFLDPKDYIDDKEEELKGRGFFVRSWLLESRMPGHFVTMLVLG